MRTMWRGVLAVALAAGANVCAPQAPANGQKPVRVRAKLDGFDVTPKTSASAPQKTNQIGGASRGLEVQLIAPAAAKTYSLTPVFSWRPEDPAMEYTFRLAAVSDPATAVYETKVSGPRLAYPASAPALEPGKTYLWTVTPALDVLGGPVSGMVVVVSGSDRDAVAAALASAPDAAARAKVLMERRLWFDALAAYSALLEQDPKRGEFRRARAQLYDQLDATHDLADADWAAAK